MTTDEAKALNSQLPSELNEWERGSEYYRRSIEQIRENIGVLGLTVRDENRLLAELRNPNSALSVNVFVQDGDDVIVYKGYRVHHSNALGTYKGGTRYDPSVTAEDCAALALAMTIKCALMGLRLGGAKGGVCVDPRLLTPAQRDAITRSYTHALGDYIGPEVDIPAPDMGTDAATMAIIENEWSHLHGGGHGVVTGKPLAMGGIKGRISATGRGIALIASLEARRLGHPLGRDYTVAVQGFGNVGSVSALELADPDRYNCRVVAISDVDCGIYNESGIDIRAAKDYALKHKTLQGFTGGDQITDAELLALPVDLLVPAAMEDTITGKNVGTIKAELIVEGANGPITAQAHQQLIERGAHVVPDVLANGGGVVVSHFETSQDISRVPWTEREVFTKMDMMLTDAYESVIKFMNDDNLTDMRAAAIVCAADRISQVLSARGSYNYDRRRAA